MALLLAAAALLTGAGPAGATARAADGPAGLSATITRTENGTPHILAKDYTSLGFGYAYAFATDDICVMADDYVTVDAQRSLFFGAAASVTQRGNGVTTSNLDSDLFWQQIADSKVIDSLVSVPAPAGPKPEILQLASGYAAGWNKYLSDVGGTNGISDPTCRGKAWVRPIDTATVWRRLYQLQLLASQDVGIQGIAEAQPPTATSPTGSTPAAVPSTDEIARDFGTTFKTLVIGSNAVAVGRAGTADHTHGLLLGNPHFPWLGTERFYQAQLTIPGELDVEGASLYGVPLILIGHTQNMAWSHTVSTAFRFTPYQLTLVPGQPTMYLQDGTPTAMTSHAVTVATSAGASVTRTLYSTRYGPVLNSLEGIPLPWTAAEAFAMRDGNAGGLGLLMNHFLDTDHAQSTREELAVLQKYQGIPWVNTIVADRGGDAMYADIGAIPNVPDSLAMACDSALGAATFQALGLPILDGSRKACDWAIDADAAQPGLFGSSHMPYLIRDDYVTNSNDSYWLANPSAPLTGFARIIGDTGTARSLRTRSGLLMTAAQIAAGGFTRQSMQDMVFSDHQYAAQLVRDDLVTVCRGLPGAMAPTSAGGVVAVGNACDVLANWNLLEDPSSRGALLFRRFWAHAVVTESVESVPPFLVPFSASDPVNTPNTLNTASPVVRTAIGDAITDLAKLGVPNDAPLSAVQYATRGSEHIPIPGGPGTYGEFNAINTGFDANTGYVDPPHGSSYVQVVTWHDATGCPDAATILTYSLSADPTSPYYADQTRMFSQKQWATERFCSADIAAHAVSTRTISTGATAPTPTLPESRVPLLLLAPALLGMLGVVLLGRRRRA